MVSLPSSSKLEGQIPSLDPAKHVKLFSSSQNGSGNKKQDSQSLHGCHCPQQKQALERGNSLQVYLSVASGVFAILPWII
jgi:hypothetical protein